MIRDTLGREWDERLVVVDQDGRIWKKPSRWTGDPAPPKGIMNRLPMWLVIPGAVLVVVGAAVLQGIGILKFEDDRPLGQMESLHK